MPRGSTTSPEQHRVLLGRGEAQRRMACIGAWLHVRDIVLVPTRRPHERGLYNTQVVWSGLIKVSVMCLKACQDSLIPMDAHK